MAVLDQGHALGIQTFRRELPWLDVCHVSTCTASNQENMILWDSNVFFCCLAAPHLKAKSTKFRSTSNQTVCTMANEEFTHQRPQLKDRHWLEKCTGGVGGHHKPHPNPRCHRQSHAPRHLGNFVGLLGISYNNPGLPNPKWNYY